MRFEVRKAAVLGAGTMGSRIAAHLANAGVDCLLLDLATPDAATRAERNGIVNRALKGLAKSRPPALFSPAVTRRLTAGNFDDDLARIAEADWIIEAVVENFEIKRDLLKRVDELRKPGSLVSSNTSGLPIAGLAEGMSEDFRKHWLGTHFFNPPRHMRLVELIPTPETAPEVTDFVQQFCDRRLGKVTVFANDRPNFIANRIFLFSIMHTLKTMLDQGLTVEEVDALTGPLIGRPRMATFRLADFTGLDICLYVAETIYRLVPEDEKREIYDPPAFLRAMVEKGLLGDKSRKGFYKKVRDVPGTDRLVFDIETMDYREPRKPSWPILEETSSIPDLIPRIKQIIESDTPPGRFLWESLSELFLYTAARIPEVTGDIASVDTTMRAGFNWQQGIFEIWNGLGVAETVERMVADGRPLPPLVEAVMASPGKSFYGRTETSETCFDLRGAQHEPLPEPRGVLRLSSVRRPNPEIASNDGATLLDLGDGVSCLAFRSKANSLDESVLAMLEQSLDDLDAHRQALIIGNEGANFSVGANLAMLLEWCGAGDWDKIEKAVGQTQALFRRLRESRKPVVAAIAGRTLAGGCELALHCTRVRAAAETYMGLVEVGVGLIPAAGGCATLLRRHTEGLGLTDDPGEATRTVFQMIGLAQVSNSAMEARERRFLLATDQVTMNRDRLLADARQTALSLAASDYQPSSPSEILVGGKSVLAALELELYLMHEARQISDHDRKIGRLLANILTGGPLSQTSWVSEDYLLGLEREAFLSLCGEEETQQRMKHILKTGKPLRN